MKIKYLKRVRKRYKYVWEDGILYTVDTKTNTAQSFKSVEEFMTEVEAHAGTGSYFEYRSRVIKRNARIKFMQYSQRISKLTVKQGVVG